MAYKDLPRTDDKQLVRELQGGSTKIKNQNTSKVVPSQYATKPQLDAALRSAAEGRRLVVDVNTSLRPNPHCT